MPGKQIEVKEHKRSKPDGDSKSPRTVEIDKHRRTKPSK